MGKQNHRSCFFGLKAVNIASSPAKKLECLWFNLGFRCSGQLTLLLFVGQCLPGVKRVSALRWTAAGRGEWGRGVISASCRALRLEGNAGPSLLASPGCSSCARVVELSSGRGRAVSCQNHQILPLHQKPGTNKRGNKPQDGAGWLRGCVWEHGGDLRGGALLSFMLGLEASKKSQRRVPCCC